MDKEEATLIVETLLDAQARRVDPLQRFKAMLANLAFSGMGALVAFMFVQDWKSAKEDSKTATISAEATAAAMVNIEKGHEESDAKIEKALSRAAKIDTRLSVQTEQLVALAAELKVLAAGGPRVPITQEDLKAARDRINKEEDEALYRQEARGE